MTDFEITTLSDASVLRLVDIRERIKIDPEYQRPGGVWSLENKQLFIDSLLNRYDIPKLYFHALVDHGGDQPFRYAIIDGRQRLEAIWDFFDGKFPLAREFVFFDSPETRAAGMTYEELVRNFPKLLARLHSRVLDVQIVDVGDIDTIEDMFSRLNEAVPLNAAERRNAFGGPLPPLFRELARHDFFRSRIKIPPTRYRHLDIAAKMVYLRYRGEFADTKRASLDYFVRHASSDDEDAIKESVDGVCDALNAMCRIFIERDALLRSSGTVIVYFVLVSNLRRAGRPIKFGRTELVEFEERRKRNRERFKTDEDDVDFRLIEFDELIRSSNDGSSIQRRCEVLLDELGLA